MRRNKLSSITAFVLIFSALTVGQEVVPLPTTATLEQTPAVVLPVNGYFGPGPLHTVIVGVDETEQREALDASGAVVGRLDYGAFMHYKVDEGRFGGRQSLMNSGLEIHDEHDLVVLNGFVLDAAHPDASLRRLRVDQTLGDPFARSLDAWAGLYLVKLSGPVQDEWIRDLESTGAKLVQYMAMNAYALRMEPEEVANFEKLRIEVDWIQFASAMHPAWRMTPGIRAAVDQRGGAALAATIQILDGAKARETLQHIAGFADRILGRVRVGPYINVHLDIDPEHFGHLAAHPDIIAIEGRGVRSRLDERQGQTVAGNTTSVGPSAPGYLSWLASQGFGSTQFGSFAVNVVDDANFLSGHPDLAGSRIIFENNPTHQGSTNEGHGFLNAHIVAGFNSSTSSALNDSAGYNYGLGIAPWARVGSTAIFGNGFSTGTTWENTAYLQGARISSNSWSFITGGGGPIPDYDSSAQEYDFIVRDARSGVSGNQQLSVLFAAGNDGPGADTISTPGTAKNIITVGASENNRQSGTDGCGVGNSGANDIDDIIGFSSRGPVDSGGGDARHKPEIMAPGTHITAGVPQSNYNGAGICNAFFPSGQTLYGWSSGTSHSTPAVAGGAALVYQVVRQPVLADSQSGDAEGVPAQFRRLHERHRSQRHPAQRRSRNGSNEPGSRVWRG